jgi:hypothetical protein
MALIDEGSDPENPVASGGFRVSQGALDGMALVASDHSFAAWASTAPAWPSADRWNQPLVRLLAVSSGKSYRHTCRAAAGARNAYFASHCRVGQNTATRVNRIAQRCSPPNPRARSTAGVWSVRRAGLAEPIRSVVSGSQRGVYSSMIRLHCTRLWPVSCVSWGSKSGVMACHASARSWQRW